MVEAFTACRKGQLPELVEPTVDPFDATAGRSGHVRDHLVAIASMPDLARETTLLPIRSNGRRSDWWSHYELRTFLTESHRLMTLAECCAAVERTFGRRFSGSTRHRYWAKRDRVVGPGPRLALPRPSNKKEAA